MRKCKEIADWAQTDDAVNVVAPTSTHVYDLAAVGTAFSAAAGRRHLLLEQAGPDVPPQGFFDCTVEVSLLVVVSYLVIPDSSIWLQIVGGGPGGSGMNPTHQNLSVVDYTVPKNVYPNGNQAIPEAYRKYVLTIECEKSAMKPALELQGQVGSFYRIENCRMKWRKGNVEGRLHTNTFKKLDVDARPRDEALDELLKYVSLGKV